jgi:Flp pilus assembly protein TadG
MNETRGSKDAFFRFVRDEGGVAAVEFALISSVFLTFVVGIYAVGLYFLTWNRLQYGTELAARYAAVHDDATNGEIEEIITDSLRIVTDDLATLEVDVGDSTSNGISFKEVSSSYTFSWDLPFLPAEMNSLTIAAESRTAVN